MKLNDRQIKLITHDGKGRKNFPDGNGLYLRVTSKQKTWSYQYRFNNRVLRFTIGRYPEISLKEARRIALELRTQRYKGINPQTKKVEQRRQQQKNFAYYYDLYYENYAKINLKSHRGLHNTFNYYLIPKLGRLKLDYIEKPVVLNIIDNLIKTDRGVTANRVLQVLKTFLKWCVQRGYMDINHIQSIEKPFKEQSRDRVLSLNEIGKLYDSCCVLAAPMRDFTRILMLSGQRLNEIASLKWEQVKESHLEFPREVSKNNKKIITPLTIFMKEIINNLKRENTFVFSSTKGIKPLNSFSKIKSKLIEQSGVNNWTFHDFRRSMATFLGDKGIEYRRIISVLNHSDSSVTSIYNRSLDYQNKLKTLDLWNKAIFDQKKSLTNTSKFNLLRRYKLKT